MQYFAGTDFSLLRFGATVGVYFNKDKFDALKIDYPYDTVREGRWTLDRFGELAKLGANLNGDAGWKYDQLGNADYGFSTWYCGISGMLFGTGVSYIERDADGAPRLSIENDRFMTACSKIAGITAEEGVFIHLNDAAANYETEFGRGRLLMTIAQIKASTNLRSSEVSFGFLPMPKLDEEQTNYYSNAMDNYSVLSVPKTVKPEDTEFVGTITEALTRENHYSVISAYYDVALGAKYARDEQSVAMLDIIMSGRQYDMSILHASSLERLPYLFRDLIAAKKTDVASKYASIESAVKAGLDDLTETYAELAK